MKNIHILIKKTVLIILILFILLIGIVPTNAKRIESQKPTFVEGKVYRVIVMFKEESILDYKKGTSYKLLSFLGLNSLEKYENSLLERHSKYKRIIGNLGLKESWDFYYVINGAGLYGDGKILNELIKADFIEGIYEDKVYTLERDITSKVIKSDLVYNLKDSLGNYITGSNIKIGIIDTGVDYTHKELGGGKFPNSKVVGGYDFADNDSDPMDYDGHGTHVAGIAAGSEKGIAKDAKIYAYKVFSKNNTSTTSSLIIRALDQAIKDKCDVVNISIGLQNGVAKSDDPLSQAVRNAVTAGVTVVAAAGNNGVQSEFFQYPITSPASVDVAIGVGASSDGMTGIINTYGKKILGQYPNESPDFKDGQYQIVYCGLGRKEDFQGIDVRGKVALIERGQIYFGDKDLNAKDAGAVGVIVYNNVSGMPKITLISQDNPSRNDFIPFLFVSFTDGQFLKEHINEVINISNEYGLGLIAEFSSAGPTSDFYLKPDLVAPGVNINSTYLNNSYVEMSGTSMASPVVAGAVALLKQAKPNLSPQEIKSLLMNTADILYNPASDRPFSPTLQGSGRVNIYNAINTNEIIFPSSLIFGIDTQSKSFSLTLKNYSSVTKTFSTSILIASNDTLTLNIPSTITVKGNSSYTFNITLSATSDVINAYGFIFFDSGLEKIHIPFVYLKDNKPKDPIYNVKINKSSITSNGSATLAFSVGVGSIGSSESYKFRESVAEEVKVSIINSKGELVKYVFDVAPIFVGDYTVTISPFNPLQNSYYITDGIYFYKVSYIEANDDENSKKVYPTLETFTISGNFNVTSVGPTGSIGISLTNNYAPFLNKGDLLQLSLDILALKPFKSLTLELHYDSTKIALSDFSAVSGDVSLDINPAQNLVTIKLSSNFPITATSIKFTLKALENGDGFVEVYNPTSDANEIFYTKGINYKISDYSKIADFNGDKKVNSQDLNIFKATLGLKKGDANFDARCDLNFDGIVDEKDFFIFAKHFGEVYP